MGSLAVPEKIDGVNGVGGVTFAFPLFTGVLGLIVLVSSGTGSSDDASGGGVEGLVSSTATSSSIPGNFQGATLVLCATSGTCDATTHRSRPRCTPRSPTGRMFGLRRENILNMLTVHGPMPASRKHSHITNSRRQPFTAMSISDTSSSVPVMSFSTLRRPSENRVARSRT